MSQLALGRDAAVRLHFGARALRGAANAKCRGRVVIDFLQSKWTKGRSPIVIASGLIAATGCMSSAVAAPISTAARSIGPIHFSYGHLSGSGVGKPSFHAILTDGFALSSSEYDVSGATAHIWGTPPAIQKITADGAGDKQVKLVLNNTAEATKVQFLSDHAEMIPAPTQDQPTRQQLTFTGHVTMYINNPAALAEKSKSTMEKAIVYLGSGPDYPMIEADKVEGTAIPAQGH